MRRIITAVCCFCTVCLLLLLCGCESRQQIREKTYFEYFDTVSVVYSYAGDSEDDFLENCREIEATFVKYHRLFDIYNEYEGINNLCTVNKNAGGYPVAVDRELIDFLLYAKELYVLTNGEMNVMMGSVLSLWHDFREFAEQSAKSVKVPTKSELDSAGEHTSIDLLEIDEVACTVRISDPEASLDVGAIGKGYAAEKAACLLKEKGVQSYVLDVGGNLRLVGTKPDGGSWSTGIKDPRNEGDFALCLNLSDTSCVTSGDYERTVELDGVRYHHIIDKDTLMPAAYFSSVTVVCENSTLADALSTALFCMSVREGHALVASLGNVEVIWITQSGEMITTDGIASLQVKD
ncbi:MAG: FAD:protein FMN transferase [Clostridia bacterium]|nr:FAD:protein FMN transferase [Clostridia bacterium]